MNKDEAKVFLNKYMTVVGSPEAIENEDRAFLKKYSTVVGSKEAIKEVCGPEEDPATWYLVKDAQSWQEAYDAGPLERYYAANPSEDLWNGTRKATFNDKQYTANIYSDAAGETLVKTGEYKAQWVSGTTQKITNAEDPSEVYFLQIFYDLPDSIFELFTDAEMTTSAGLYVKMTSVSFPGFAPAYEAVDLSVQPWAVIDVPMPFEGIIKFVYNDAEYYPWGNLIRKFTKGYAIASLPGELGVPCLPEGADFEKDSLTVTLIDAKKL